MKKIRRISSPDYSRQTLKKRDRLQDRLPRFCPVFGESLQTGIRQRMMIKLTNDFRRSSNHVRTDLAGVDDVFGAADGSGLGLAIVSEIAAVYGCKTQCANTDKGFCVTVSK